MAEPDISALKNELFSIEGSLGDLETQLRVVETEQREDRGGTASTSKSKDFRERINALKAHNDAITERLGKVESQTVAARDHVRTSSMSTAQREKIYVRLQGIVESLAHLQGDRAALHNRVSVLVRDCLASQLTGGGGGSLPQDMAIHQRLAAEMRHTSDASRSAEDAISVAMDTFAALQSQGATLRAANAKLLSMTNLYGVANSIINSAQRAMLVNRLLLGMILAFVMFIVFLWVCRKFWVPS